MIELPNAPIPDPTYHKLRGERLQIGNHRLRTVGSSSGLITIVVMTLLHIVSVLVRRPSTC